MICLWKDNNNVIFEQMLQKCKIYLTELTLLNIIFL